MKVVILAGGFGTRISEESHLKPKPMIEIGGKPILWHIMKYYSSFGYHEFIICCGYKQHVIKEWFADYYLHNSDITFDFTDGNKMTVHNNFAEPWKVTLIDTGLNTMTGGRIKRIKEYVNNEPFMLTYGDGVSNIDLNALEKFHRLHGKIGTVTAVSAGQRFGILDMDSNGNVNHFREKNQKDASSINGGYMIMSPQIFDFIEGDETVFEREPLETIANIGELKAYRHDGFWKCMDTKRDHEMLEEMITLHNAPWMIWEK